MKSFLQRFGAVVLGVLMGIDRWRFRGSKRMLCYPEDEEAGGACRAGEVPALLVGIIISVI